MSRKNRPQYHEPNESISTDMETPIEDTIEVGDVVLIEDPVSDTVELGTVLMVDGPFEPAPLGTGFESGDDFSAPPPSAPAADLSAADALIQASQDAKYDSIGLVDGDDLLNSQPSSPAVDFGAADKAQDAVGMVQDKVQDKAQDMAQNVTQTAQGVADKAQGAAQDIAGKAQEAVQGVAGKVQDVTQTASDKAKDAAQKIADNAASAKDTAAAAGTKSKNVVVGAASTAGTSLWSLVQRNPLQAILFLSSLIWLVRNNQATASLPPVSVTDAAGDAAEKVGTVAGQVQVAASNLGAQVQEQGQRGAGWFAQTLQTNPLAIGAMGIVFGAGLGFAVPETSYENKTLGKTRDDLVDKAQAAAQDIGQKVSTVAQTAVHDAIESGKTEAKNQGLTPQ